MTKCFSIALFLINVTTLFLFSCNNRKSIPKTKDTARFEQLLQVAKLQDNDSVRYLIWNSTSCGGCRATCVKLLQNDTLHHIKLIVPYRFAAYIGALSPSKLFIDTNDIFDKVYFGVDNIGIVNVYNGNVADIRNYNPEAMDSLAIDLLR